MLCAEMVFFVFNQKDAARLAQKPALLDGVDCVVAVVPGITLDSVSTTVKRLTLEQALEAFKISQRDISSLASAYCLALMAAEAMAQIMPILGVGTDDSVRVALLNHIGLLTHNAFAFEQLYQALLKRGLRKARCFQFHGGYRLVERLDIRTLLHVELGFGPHLAHLCSQANVDLDRVDAGDRLSPMKNALRDILLLGYKAKTLFQRSRSACTRAGFEACDAAFIVRARTEVVAAEPLLRWRAKKGLQDVMLVDDLIKSPDGTAAASATPYDWQPLHAYSTSKEIVKTFLRCIMRRGAAARRGMAHRQERVASWGFLGQPAIARQVLYTAFASVPELLVHRLQLERALDQLKPAAVVSFDTVDRWGAMQGELARLRGLRSVMVQNCAADDLVYPWPLPMDHLVVSNERLRDIFLASGADPKRVHAFGLPLQDDVLIAGNARLETLCQRAARSSEPLRIMITTQPFVQEFDYNSALIDDLAAAIKSISFETELILKPHPREAKGKYDGVVETLSSRALKVTQVTGPFEATMDLADIVLSRMSTTLEFAALGGVPGISHLNKYPRDILDRLYYLGDPVTEKSFEVEDLCHIIEGFSPEKRVETLKKYADRRARFLTEFFPGKGLARQRVVDLMAGRQRSC